MPIEQLGIGRQQVDPRPDWARPYTGYILPLRFFCDLRLAVDTIVRFDLFGMPFALVPRSRSTAFLSCSACSSGVRCVFMTSM